ncbi:MAG: pentapeptide repeat-containing protein [Candidatus Omnitrophota bacterium]
MTERCKFEKCKKGALFSSEFCWDHAPEKDSYREKLMHLVRENVSLRGVNLSKADLRGLDLAQKNLSGANLSRVNLCDSNLFDANLKNAELLGADLSNCDLTSANLEGSDLTRSNLEGARLWHANLENANLIEANLSHADLWNARLFNVRFWRTNFIKTISLGKKNFHSRKNKYVSIYRINEKGILSSEEAYRSLKRYFIVHGRYSDASWASFKEKTMERYLLKKKGDLAYLPNLLMNLLCGYGEKPHRIILSSIFVILFYASLFLLLHAITYAPSRDYAMSVGDYIYYSIITFTTVGYGDFIPKAAPLFRFLAASEGFIGAFMIGLFIFTLARKYSAR